MIIIVIIIIIINIFVFNLSFEFKETLVVAVKFGFKLLEVKIN